MTSPRIWRARSVFLLSVALFAVAMTARAEVMDAPATALADAAMNRDFLNANFKAARKNLEKAIALCGGGGDCSVKVQGRLHRDLAVVLINGLSDVKHGESEIMTAVSIDPELDLDPAFLTPQLTAAYEKARALVPKVELTEETPEKKSRKRRHHAPEPEEAPAEAALDGCHSDSDCAGGTCEGGRCQAPRKPSKVWLALSLAQDLAVVSGTDVCTRESQLDGGFSCFRASGSQYHGTPVRGRSDDLATGFVPATTRIVIGLDAMLSRAVGVGVRLGYTLRGRAPRSDGGSDPLPVLAEARFAYWFVSPPGEKFAPYAAVSGGVAEVDAPRSTFVVEDRSVPPPANQIDNPDVQKLDVWKKMGRAFVGIGPGFVLPLTRRSGLTAEARALFPFPDGGFDIQVLAGYAVGL